MRYYIKKNVSLQLISLLKNETVKNYKIHYES